MRAVAAYLMTLITYETAVTPHAYVDCWNFGDTGARVVTGAVVESPR
jgi:hypothetical protein